MRRLSGIVGLIGYLALSGNALAIEPGVSAEVSYEFLDLPESRFSNTFNFVTQSFGTTQENHDGEVDGGRLDLGLGGRGTFQGMPIIAGIKGYYAQHDDSQTLGCTSTLTAACNRFPLFDPDPNLQSGVGYGAGNVAYVSKLDADTWGVALEAQTGGTRPVLGGTDVKLGAAYRRIDTNFSIDGGRVSGGLPIPFTLDEDNDTGYLGGYIGAVGKLPIGSGFAIVLDGDVGLYWAHTEYDGRYVSTGSPGPNNVSQSLSLDRDDASVIASVKLSLEKDYGAFRVSMFGKGEYYSYAPEIRYNNIDRIGGVPFGGTQDGTVIGDDDAWTASAGGSVTVPFN